MDDLKPFLILLVFGNIENLVLSSQGVVAGVNPVKLGIASFIAVAFWLTLGTFGTQIALPYVDFIDFGGGLIIFILGAQAMLESIRGE